MEDLIPTQPDPKKLKMSTTTSDDDTTTTTIADAADKPVKYKRRKIAIYFAYCGVGYQGMQKNPGAKTIEGEFEEALFQAGAVPEGDRGCPKRFDWARSARTDKGVSAVGQVVSGRFYVDPEGLVERINKALPEQIRVFGYKRVTASFNAKKFCDRRRYVYLIPIFALDPSSHPDRESVLASMGSGNELAKCLECSERGRKVEGVMGKRVFEPRDPEIQVMDGENAVLKTEVGEESRVINNSDATDLGIHETVDLGVAILESKKVEEIVVTDDNDANSDSPKNKVDDIGSDIPENLGLSSNSESTFSEIGTNNEKANHEPEEVEDGVMETDIPKNVDLGMETKTSILPSGEYGDVNWVTPKEIDNGEVNFEQPNGKEEGAVKGTEFRYGEKEKERFNRILKKYEGTHNFHNFTTRIKAEDPSAKRYIISFEANTVVNVGGIDFVKCEVVGQSFMLHQIRKMIGVAVAIMRNCADESLIEMAFQQNLNITVPTAPEVGLYLDECFFTSYNQKWKDTHEEVSMKAYVDEAEEFKMKYIYSHIASTEHKEGSVALWLHSLNHRNYPDLRLGGKGEGKGEEPK